MTNNLLPQRIHSDEWICSDILPEFRNALAQTLPMSSNLDADSMSIMSLSVARYRPALFSEIPASIITRSSLSLATKDGGAASFWEMVVSSSAAQATWVAPDTGLISNLKTAVELINHYCPSAYLALVETISNVCAIQAPFARSFSSPHLFGCLFINLYQTPAEIAVSMVHELAHQELFLLNLIDRLVTASSDFNLVHAPFQGKSRPPIGRLHSAHALYRMISLGSANGRLESHIANLERTILTFATNDLTAMAKELVYEVYPKYVSSFSRLECGGESSVI